VRTDRGVLVVLTQEQVAEVAQDLAGERLVRVLASLDNFEELRRVSGPLLAEKGCSTETVRALLVLVAFPSDGSNVDVSSVAARVGVSPSTTYRYVRALLGVGLLERDPLTNRCRRTRVLPLSGVSGAGVDA
jgi:DNA-binding MarR family transcriptional regulator